jgi:hypothetical protein
MKSDPKVLARAKRLPLMQKLSLKQITLTSTIFYIEKNVKNWE